MNSIVGSLATGPSWFIILFGLVYIVLYFWSLRWLYSDAQKRNNTGCLMVAIIGMFAWPIGLIIWLLARPEPIKLVEPRIDVPADCSRCGYCIPINVSCCPNCGEHR